MINTRNLLSQYSSQVEESMGVRKEAPRAKLSPRPRSKDIGRGALRTYGTLEINQIIADPDQPRTEFDQEQLARLALSIRDKGQLAPIRVRWSEQHDKWIIVCGERRFRAHCVVRDDAVSHRAAPGVRVRLPDHVNPYLAATQKEPDRGTPCGQRL